jgi:hypothetical protein
MYVAEFDTDTNCIDNLKEIRSRLDLWKRGKSSGLVPQLWR